MFNLLFVFFDCIRKFTSRLQKVVQRLFSKKGEIERICWAGGFHTYYMSIRFAKSLKRSKQLSTYSRIIFFPKLFSVEAAFQNIINVKKIIVDVNAAPGTRILSMNIMHCLQSLRNVNAVINSIEIVKKTPVDLANAAHVALLDRFWTNMRPGIRKESGKDWGEVGFQGKDPCSDFRGMGLLGLQQLVFISCQPIALDILRNAEHPVRYYPFACTGINISAFIIELIKETRLHSSLLQSLEAGAMSISVDDNKSGGLLTLGCNAIHSIYCEIFALFSATWQSQNAPNVMDFPLIFSEVKSKIRRKYAVL